MTLATLSAEPSLGDMFGPVRIELTPDLVAAYVASTGDDTFDAHRGRMRLECGWDVAPPTIFDRDVGTRLASTRYSIDFAMHAKQTLRWHKPLLCGASYSISGELHSIFESRGIRYFSIVSHVSGLDGSVSLESVYTRAFQFPRSQHPGARREPLTLSMFLAKHACPGHRFPQVGGVLHGSSRLLNQSLMNLYSGPSANIHTDHWSASIRGLDGPIVQGLMALNVENALFRDVFGEAWYVSGEVSTTFIRPIAKDSILTPVSVVVSEKNGEMTFASAVFDQHGLAVTISAVGVNVKT